MASAVTSLTNLTEILTGVEQKLEGAVTKLKSRLQEVAASERESIALVDEACSHVQIMFEDCRSKLKELTTRAHTEINCSIQDTHTALVKRLGEVTSHKRILGRAMLATPRPALIHSTSALHKRINSLHFEVDLHQDWMRYLPTLGSCHELERQIVKDLKEVVEKRKYLQHANLLSTQIEATTSCCCKTRQRRSW
ncbi:uncharacterized protein LOC112574674 [Pomacea canaliculata]|uniref:uncharacterized protein LOC112574674 n=1 Tax=Pomacea canaliculata TaxID=400727 RepID=UPI000D735CEE|nr:uncharacterized protein LOC112574674 [Pomacea canaliculata]